MERRDPVVLAWALGLGVAVLIYVFGPRNFLFHLLDSLNVVWWQIGMFIASLSAVALDGMRALAIGLYATFAILGLAVLRRGGRARGALIVITAMFMLLVWHEDQPTESNGRWAAALALSAVGAVVMTGRLRQSALVPRGY